MKTWMKIVLIITAIILALSLLIYWRFWGFTAKQKYSRCAATCEKVMIMESNIPLCQSACADKYNYEPEEEKSTNTSSSKADKNDQYSCEWSWPQKIIDQNKEVVKVCPTTRPYCNYADHKYENVGCCDYNETTKIYSNCLMLKDM